MTPEDLAEMGRWLEQEALLHRSGFEPVLPDGRELWMRDLELFSRGRALVVSLEELAGEGERDRESVRRILSNGHR